MDTDQPSAKGQSRLQLGQLRLDDRTVAGSRRYAARFVSAGRISAAGGAPGHFSIPPEAIETAVYNGLFDSLPCFVDHPGWFDHASLKDIAGITIKAANEYNHATESADGVIQLYDTPSGDLMKTLFDSVLQDQESGIEPPDIGLSIVFYPAWKDRDPDKDYLELDRFIKVDSVDFVFSPAADGRIKEALSTLNTGGVSMTEERTPYMTEAPEDAPEPQVPDLSQELSEAQAWMEAARAAAIPGMLAQSGLPQASRDRLAEGTYATADEMTAAIERERAFLAQLAEDNVVDVGGAPPRGAGIALGRTGLEQLAAALDHLLGGEPLPSGVAPLSGIREAYHLLSGDFEMTGLFMPERVYLANVTSATMAGLVANALNKRVINMYQEYPKWWAPIVTIEDFPTLQDVRWITLGGIGELPTVSEGAAYTELTWDDMTETDAFVKKGGYLGLTLEAMDKDDTGKIRAAPRALAQAAWLTLSKSISAIFTQTSGTGPTMSDSVVLFDSSTHGNLLTTALSHAAYVAVRTAMRKQTELNSSERLGALTAPKFLLVPPDLEITALQVLATEQVPGTADWNENPFAMGNVHDARMNAARKRVIVVDLWTDTNDWAAVADPNLYPSIGLGFRYGRTPEIFSVASPTAGLMFTNDTMPIKVRFFYAVGPTDWRGLHKNNVT